MKHCRPQESCGAQHAQYLPVDIHSPQFQFRSSAVSVEIHIKEGERRGRREGS